MIPWAVAGFKGGDAAHLASLKNLSVWCPESLIPRAFFPRAKKPVAQRAVRKPEEEDWLPKQRAFPFFFSQIARPQAHPHS